MSVCRSRGLCQFENLVHGVDRGVHRFAVDFLDDLVFEDLDKLIN